MISWQRLTIGLSALAALACTRESGESSRFAIRAPEHLSAKGQGAFAAMPSDRAACYGINIKGVGTPVVGNQCSPPTGILLGFVGPGKEVEASVPRGSTITVELYLYLQPPGQNLPCPTFVPALAADQLSNMYLVGSSQATQVNDETAIIEIEAVFPGVGQTLAHQLSMPSVCRAPSGPSQNVPVLVSAGEQVLMGSGVVVRARAGGAAAGTVLSGSNVRVLVR